MRIDEARRADGDDNPPGRWRLFVAIPVPAMVKDGIEQAQGELRRALPADAVGWTKRAQFHLTLKFLGDVDSPRVEALAAALRRAAEAFPPLQLHAERIGFFPDMRYPRVVWAWVHDAKEELPKLQQAIEAASAGFTAEASEEKFTGHITLGRSKRIKRPQAEILAKLALGMVDRFFGEWTAHAVELIRSELGAGGPRYTTLAAIPLSGKPPGGEFPE